MATPESGEVVNGQAVQVMNIVARDNVFEPRAYAVKGSQLVSLTITNEGKNVHEVVLAGQRTCCTVDPTPLRPRESRTWSRFVLRPDTTYTLFCNIHQDQGMVGSVIARG